jgi:putative membrane protein
MIVRSRRIGAVRAGLALCGLVVAAALGWRVLAGADLALLFNGWVIPAVALLHLVEQGVCGCAWHNLVEPPRPPRWDFFRIRWVRNSVAALVPVSGVGAALVAVRLAMQAGLRMDVAAASLVVDATMEMISQIIFTALGLSLLVAFSPGPLMPGWIAAGLSLAILTVGAFIAAQRGGGLRLIDSGLSRLAHRWPRLLPLTEARLNDRLMRVHQQRWAALVSGSLHLGAWLLGAGEIWLVLYALGRPASPATCVIIESLSMVARSAGFLVPGALGVQEAALVMVGNLVGLSPETAMLIAVAKRLRDVAVGVPGLLLWQWTEGRRDSLAQPIPEMPDPAEP